MQQHNIKQVHFVQEHISAPLALNQLYDQLILLAPQEQEKILDLSVLDLQSQLINIKCKECRDHVATTLENQLTLFNSLDREAKLVLGTSQLPKMQCQAHSKLQYNFLNNNTWIYDFPSYFTATEFRAEIFLSEVNLFMKQSNQQTHYKNVLDILNTLNGVERTLFTQNESSILINYDYDILNNLFLTTLHTHQRRTDVIQNPQYALINMAIGTIFLSRLAQERNNRITQYQSKMNFKHLIISIIAQRIQEKAQQIYIKRKNQLIDYFEQEEKQLEAKKEKQRKKRQSRKQKKKQLKYSDSDQFNNESFDYETIEELSQLEKSLPLINQQRKILRQSIKEEWNKFLLHQ